MITNSAERFDNAFRSWDRTHMKALHIPVMPDGNWKKVLYISGGMSGYAEHNFPLFNKAAKQFRDLGFFVFNPAENFDGVTEKLSYDIHFLEDIIQVTLCTHIYMMEGWQKSKGAYCEYLIARRLNLIFVDEQGIEIVPPQANEIPAMYEVKDIIAEQLKAERPALEESIKSMHRQRDVAEQGLAVAMSKIKELTAENEKLSKNQIPPPEKAIRLKGTVAEIAQKLVFGDRRETYNHPYYNFKQTADLWTALGFRYNYKPIEPENIAEAMVLVKMSREAYKHKDDNLVDIVGYVLCQEAVLQKKEELIKEEKKAEEDAEDYVD